jgi:hypothetical protein
MCKELMIVVEFLRRYVKSTYVMVLAFHIGQTNRSTK